MNTNTSANIRPTGPLLVPRHILDLDLFFAHLGRPYSCSQHWHPYTPTPSPFTHTLPYTRNNVAPTMLSAPRKNAGRRLSSLFSMGSADSKDSNESKDTSSTTSSQSSSRLSKVKKRIVSHSLTPDYPAPDPSPRSVPPTAPVTIQHVESASAAFEPLEPPPPLTSSNPNSRSSSPSRLNKSRPVTPGSTPNGGLLIPSDPEVKKNRRRSKLFGYGDSSDERVQDGQRHVGGPLAWVVGHKGKVEYSLTLLLNGERVCLYKSGMAGD